MRRGERRSRNNNESRPNNRGRNRKIAVAGALALAAVLGYVGRFEQVAVIEGGAEMAMDSYHVEYAPLDCSSEVTALSGATVSGHNKYSVFGFFSVQTGSVNVNKDEPLQWKECTGNKAVTPAFVGKSQSGIVNNVRVIVPTPKQEGVGVADLSINECIPAKNGDPQSEIQTLRAEYKAKAMSGNIPKCDGGSGVSGFVVGDSTSFATSEAARQFAVIDGYLQPIPHKAEMKIMENEKRYVIAEEQSKYPGAKITAVMQPTESPMASTIDGLKALSDQTDVKFMFSDMHFVEDGGQTKFELTANNLTGNITLEDDPMNSSQIRHLNAQVPHLPRV